MTASAHKMMIISFFTELCCDEIKHMQVVRRPAVREPLPEVRRFALLSSREAASGEHAAEQAVGAASACRWTIPAGGSVDIWLSFQSQDVGVSQQTITFEVLIVPHSSYVLCCKS